MEKIQQALELLYENAHIYADLSESDDLVDAIFDAYALIQELINTLTKGE